MIPFRAAVEARDLDALTDTLAEDVVFRSPVVYKPYEGRDAVRVLLGAALRVFEDFRYDRQLGDAAGGEHALFFTARVGDREVNGMDFLHVNEEGLVDELMVMVRPMSGLTALAAAMKAQLEAAQGQAA